MAGSTASSTASNTMEDERGNCEPSRLELLPGEILNRIYRYVVVKDSIRTVASTYVDAKGRERKKSNEPALSRVCRRFRAEVLPIYYAENTFTFIGFSDFDQSNYKYQSWLLGNATAADHITSVGMKYDLSRHRENDRPHLPAQFEVRATLISNPDSAIRNEEDQVETHCASESIRDPNSATILPYSIQTDPPTTKDCYCWADTYKISITKYTTMTRTEMLAHAMAFCRGYFVSLYYDSSMRKCSKGRCKHCGRPLTLLRIEGLR